MVIGTYYRMTNKDIICLIETRNAIICANKTIERELDAMDCGMCDLQEKINCLNSDVCMLRDALVNCYDDGCELSQRLQGSCQEEKMLLKEVKRQEAENCRLLSLYNSAEQKTQCCTNALATSGDLLSKLIDCVYSLNTEANNLTAKMASVEQSIQQVQVENQILIASLKEAAHSLEVKNNHLMALSEQLNVSQCCITQREVHKAALQKYGAELDTKVLLYESLVEQEKAYLQKQLDKLYSAKEKCFDLKLPQKIERHEREMESLRKRKVHFLNEIREKIKDAKSDNFSYKEGKESSQECYFNNLTDSTCTEKNSPGDSEMSFIKGILEKLDEVKNNFTSNDSSDSACFPLKISFSLDKHRKLPSKKLRKIEVYNCRHGESPRLADISSIRSQKTINFAPIASKESKYFINKTSISESNRKNSTQNITNMSNHESLQGSKSSQFTNDVAMHLMRRTSSKSSMEGCDTSEYDSNDLTECDFKGESSTFDKDERKKISSTSKSTVMRRLWCNIRKPFFVSQKWK